MALADVALAGALEVARRQPEVGSAVDHDGNVPGDGGYEGPDDTREGR
jgi:hypothetical protein